MSSAQPEVENQETGPQPELGAYSGPNLQRTLQHLEISTTHIAQSLEASMQASAHAIEEIAKFSTEQFESLANDVSKYASDVEEATSFAHSYVAKCAQLDNEMSRVARFEEQLNHVQSLLPALTQMVVRKIQTHEAKKAAEILQQQQYRVHEQLQRQLMGHTRNNVAEAPKSNE